MLKKLAMPFVKFKMDEAVSVGAHVLQERLPFDELACLKENSAFVMQALGLGTFSAFTTTDAEASAAAATTKVADALPGTPAVDPAFADAPVA
jgi:leucyl-tRNA synthetase